MTGLSNRSVGRTLAAAGVVLSVFHLVNIVRRGATPTNLFVEGIPLVLSVTLVTVGALLARDRLIARGFAERMVAWIVAGVAALCALGAWHFTILIVIFDSPLPVSAATLDVATFGALAGALVGIYDVRARERQESIERLHRINDTIRIATQELVNRTDRDALERAVCDRLAESDPYEGVWFGRYDADAERVRPSARAGLEDEYVESIEVTVDDSPTGTGAGGRAIKTREIQCVPDVFADQTMEPWWEEFERRGVTSIAVVPIAHGETVYGFVSIYADRRTVFDDHEQAVLAELGESIGHAVASLEARDRLAKREAELARQNERLDAFAGIVSHDLRNPLNVALGNVALAREQRDADGPLADAAAALARMEDLIRDLLVLSRQGETIDDLEAVPLGDVVDAAWSTTADSSAATLRIDGDLGTVPCDQERLRQLLENLFRNSVDHAGPGVTVTVRRTDSGFAVFDDGPGIPTDLEDRIFETGVTTDDDGTGFGLDIVRTIADAHGWSVSLCESPDGGACFEFAGVEARSNAE